MKIVIPGGSGQVGGVLARALLARGHDVVVLSRGGAGPARAVPGRLLGAGFRFEFPSWPEAARDLVRRWGLT